MKFTIIFVGLIAQIPHGNERLAVFIESPKPPHRAWLRVGENKVVKNPWFTDSLVRINKDCPAGYRCYSLEGEHVTVSGVPTGSTTLEPSFKKHVPHLRDITAPPTHGTVTISPNVLNRKAHQDVKGDLSFAGGSLSVDRVWCPKVAFDDHGDSELTPPGPMCVAYEITYRSSEIKNNPKFVELTSDTGRVLRVDPDAEIHVENVPDPRQTTHVAHFHHHRLILDDARVMAEMIPTAANDTCATAGLPLACVNKIPVGVSNSKRSEYIEPHSIDYECTGSQWP
ncbi:MAG TPA: hypothetical protein VND45_08740 [Thermoanaerobaculia bacterium]|jgi:hypothetical protein|nr:hypothetical protein [Thermoanaerobaculia bacterium]